MATTTTTTTQEDLESRDDWRWDGNWPFLGHDGMMQDLEDVEHFLEQERKEQEEETSTTQDDDDDDALFLTLPAIGGGEEQDEWATFLSSKLQPRNLCLADAVMRRFAEGRCPPKFRIRTLSASIMKSILDYKQKGNAAFSKQEYYEAISQYQNALDCCGKVKLYVAPKDQIETIVTILSNLSECFLRLKKYQQAGKTATDALVLDNSHEKSRMRRVKAELGLAGAPQLIQAKLDLEEIINVHYSKAGVQQANEYLEEVNKLLEMEKQMFAKAHPESEDWDFFVRLVSSKCW